eukprot:c29059_g1_i2 orf=464-2509(+)
MNLQQPFALIENTAAPDPSSLWSSDLKKAPLPTNSGWQNFVLKEGSCPEYIHPYLIQFQGGAMSICYPTRAVQPAFIFQAFVPNLTIRSEVHGIGTGGHVVTHYDDLTVSLQLSGYMTVPLARGSPYVTCLFNDWCTPTLSTIHAVMDIKSNEDHTKHKITLNNGQTWVLYSTSPLPLSSNLGFSGRFKGVVRIALLRGGNEGEAILDRYRSAYPVEGIADLSVPFQVKYQWKTKGSGELLMLSHALHREIISYPSERNFFHALSYNGIDGKLVAVTESCWILNEVPISVGWHSSRGVLNRQARQKIASALRQDVASLQPITTASTYFFGKAVARAARMALIAEEICLFEVIGSIRDFLVESLTPWMEGTFRGNGLFYDSKWGGIISRDGARDPGADFGLGVYNDHHYHLGYFCYAGAVLAKLDPGWGHAYRDHLFTIVGDYMTPHHYHDRHDHHRHWHLHFPVHHRISTQSHALFPRFRNFDLWVLHSWAGGLTEFADGRNQESTSEAVNAYYSAFLLGLAFGDVFLITAGLTLASLEIRAARTLWHVPSSCTLYEPEFVAQNRVVGVLWANKRDTGLWFASAKWRECCLGIQLLPILPITEVLFQDLEFVQELVQWAWPALSRDGVKDGWKGFVYALQALYAPEEALHNVLSLAEHDDGNSLSNLLWWIFSRWPLSSSS